MSDSRAKYEELENLIFTRTTTQDKLGNFEKNEETLFRDIIDEVKEWSEEWLMSQERGTKSPIDADVLSKELSKRYRINLK